ncbi:hypothetical protein IFM89_003911 [Coptis chinensis]|uniref:Uncharacterized protein n=1 Tax=Coptis chinensis TaxID=261450 RepID=A0A835ILZ4_9MAGN|nr:hypothetical protein IFM89_003911 [Coptis chinensis]
MVDPSIPQARQASSSAPPFSWNSLFNDKSSNFVNEQLEYLEVETENDISKVPSFVLEEGIDRRPTVTQRNNVSNAQTTWQQVGTQRNRAESSVVMTTPVGSTIMPTVNALVQNNVVQNNALVPYVCQEVDTETISQGLLRVSLGSAPQPRTPKDNEPIRLSGAQSNIEG